MSLRRHICVSSLFVACLSLAACSPVGTPTGTEGAEKSESIIGGTVTQGSPSVVLVKAETGNTGSWCTGTVIAKRLVLTAAHCVEDAGPNTKIRVMFGYDQSLAKPADHVQVTKWHMDPQYMVTNNIAAGHDAAVLILASDALAPAQPINRKAMAKSMVGSKVHVVGFGNNNGWAGTGSGIKREIHTTLHSLEQGVINVGKGGQTTCQGDSGGPSFMNIDGVDVVVGITSYGEMGCVSYGSSTRVDLSAGWIDPFIAANGGAPDGGGGSGGSGGSGGQGGSGASGGQGGGDGGGDAGGGDGGDGGEGGEDPGECVPSCGDKECGSDGCAGICGICTPGESCSAAGKCSGSAPPEGGCSESEPNDDVDAANELCAAGAMTGTIDWAADHDNFTFQVGAGQTYDLTLTTEHQYVMTLYKVVSSGLYEITSAFDHIEKTTPDGGTYYVELWGANGDYSPTDTYELKVAITN